MILHYTKSLGENISPLFLCIRYCTWYYDRELKDKQFARIFTLINLTGWFGSYCLVRTLGNSIEYCLTTILLYFVIVWRRSTTIRSCILGILITLAVFVRPTAILLLVRLSLRLIHSLSLIISVDTYLSRGVGAEIYQDTRFIPSK